MGTRELDRAHAPRGAPPAGEAIAVAGLRKTYGDAVALDGVDLAVDAGEVVALLGPNGSGKTTTVEILEGFRAPDAGNARVLGVDPRHPTREWRARIGMVLQTSSLPSSLTARELLSRFAAFYPAPRGVEETLELVGLAGRARSRAGSLSGGQQRRLDVAIALVGDPELIFLDEPTTGFDPAARHQAWDMVAELRRLGKTVLLTTHYMDEAEALADRVAVLVRGRVVACDTPDRLGGRDRAPARARFALPEGVTQADLPTLAGARATVHGRSVELRLDDPVPALGALLDWARGRAVDLPGLVVERPTLEDVYLSLTEESR